VKRKIKDPVSGFSHLFGMFLSIAGLVLLIITAVNDSNGVYDIVSFTIFGASLILLYAASSIYHLLNLSEHANTILKKFDHIMIYILIAGSYTPICLGVMRGGWGWSIFGVVWGLAISGLFLTIFWIKAPRWFTTGIYLGMGWIVLIAIYPIIIKFKSLGGLSSLWWLLAGGISYSIGAVIYGLKWPKFKNNYFGFHEIFHIFILLGSFFQFWFVFNYLPLL